MGQITPHHPTLASLRQPSLSLLPTASSTLPLATPTQVLPPLGDTASPVRGGVVEGVGVAARRGTSTEAAVLARRSRWDAETTDSGSTSEGGSSGDDAASGRRRARRAPCEAELPDGGGGGGAAGEYAWDAVEAAMVATVVATPAAGMVAGAARRLAVLAAASLDGSVLSAEAP